MIPAAASSRYAGRVSSVTGTRSPEVRRRSRDRADSDNLMVSMNQIVPSGIPAWNANLPSPGWVEKGKEGGGKLR
jgi:hypothetical protein